MNFLTEYVNYNKGIEVPPLFALWCGVAGLSSVFSRRVWINMGRFELYPNLYTILVAPSARSRKSTAIGIIEGMVRETNPTPKLIAQSLTPEAMVDALRLDFMEGSQGKIGETRTICDGFVFADELVTFLNPTSYERGLGSYLLSFFDCHKTWSYHTKSGGEQIVNNLCLGLLAGTTANLLSQAIPEQAVGHGLTSRIIFVYSDQRMDPIPWPEIATEKKKDLVEFLNKALKVSGEMKFEPDAKQRVGDIYVDFFKNSPMYDDKYLQGYAGRRHTHLIKLSTLLALSEDCSMIVETRHVMAAHTMLLKTEERMPTVMELVTSTKTGDVMSLILQTVEHAARISRVELLRKYSHRLTSKELELYIDTLKQAGSIIEESMGGTTYYIKPKGKAQSE